MQYPSDWFVYIIPGFLYLSCIYFRCSWTYKERINELLIKTPVGLAVTIILSFIVGIATNWIIVNILRPICVYIGWLPTMPPFNTGNEVLVAQNKAPLSKLVENSYHTMLCLRSLVIPLAIFVPIGIYHIWYIKKKDAKLIFKILVSIIIIFTPVIIFIQWEKSRIDYNNIRIEESKYINSIINATQQSGKTK